MSPYALAIFDFDGTLADSWRLMGQAIIEAADRFGYRRPSPEEAQAMRGLDNRDEARDITAARQAGIASGAVTWGYATRDLLVSCGPTHVFDTVDDVIATLLVR